MITFAYYITQPHGTMPLPGLILSDGNKPFEQPIRISHPNPFYHPVTNPNRPMTDLCTAYGIVRYDRALSPEDLIRYQLIPAPVKKAIWCDHRIIGHAFMTQETADMLNAMPEAGVYYGSEQPYELQGTEDE